MVDGARIARWAGARSDTGGRRPRDRVAFSVMNSQIEPSRSKPPILKRAVAGLVLVAVAALAIHLVIGLVVTVFWIVAIAAVIVAVIWALNNVL
jgi:hypothetical protein